MEIFKFCEIAQMKNLKEKMHWSIFWLIVCRAVKLILGIFLIFFKLFLVLSILKNWSCIIKA